MELVGMQEALNIELVARLARQCVVVLPPFWHKFFHSAKDLLKLYISISSMILPIRQCLYAFNK